MRIVHAITCVNEATGGPAVSIPSLAAALARRGHESTVVTMDYAELGPILNAEPATVVAIKSSYLRRRVADWSGPLRRSLRDVVQGADIVHNHGLWLFPNRYAATAARRSGIPYVISPRGMLAPSAMQRGSFKKTMMWHVSERRNLQIACAFHATSPDEARAMRLAGIRRPIAIIPNGITAVETSTQRVSGQHPPDEGRYVLFLSRLHPHKGLELLLQAWRTVHAHHPRVRLVIAGPDTTGYRAILERRVGELALGDVVSFVGQLSGDRKEVAYARADAFVLPSLSENFGMVVGEALAHGVPVIATRGTPWSSLIEHQCGWWVDHHEGAIAGALLKALSLTPRERREFGERGRALVSRKFSWDRIGAEMEAFYLWIRDDACQPATAPSFIAE